LLNLSDVDAVFEFALDMRYVGQAFELSIPVPGGDVSRADATALRAAFEEEHERRFGHKFDAGNDVEVVAVKVTATARDNAVSEQLRAHKPDVAPAIRDAYFGEAFGILQTPVIGRGDLTPAPRNGPFIVEEYEGTTVVPPDASAHIDAFDNIVIDLEYGK